MKEKLKKKKAKRRREFFRIIKERIASNCSVGHSVRSPLNWPLDDVIHLFLALFINKLNKVYFCIQSYIYNLRIL